MKNHKVDIKDMRREVDPSSLSTEGIKDMYPHETIFSQKRAVKVLDFGVGNKAFGFNIYVSGDPGTDTLTSVKNYISKKSGEQDAPPDWCYVNNFKDSYYPKALKLPNGKAVEFREDMQDFIKDVKKSLNKAFEGEEYLNQKETIHKSIDQKKNELFLNLNN